MTDAAPVADTITMTREDLAALMEATVERALKKARKEDIDANAPPKLMKAKVADGFIKGSHRGAHLAHYRVDGKVAEKIAEINMDRLEYYLGEGEDELPLDSFGRPRSARTVACMPGKWITVVNGDIYPTSENQLRQLEWLRTQPSEEGGLPTMYEVTGGGQEWICVVCKPSRHFPNKATWENHRLATHGIPKEAAEAIAA